MNGLMPETVIYGVKEGEKYESVLDARATHLLTEEMTEQAVAKAKSLGYTDVRVANYTYNGETDKPDFAKAIAI